MDMTIYTEPVPKGRPRFYGGHAVTPEKTRRYEKLIRDSWTHGLIDAEDVIVHMVFVMPIPKSYSKKKQAALVGASHTKKPDLDNLVKAVLDALNGKAFADDSVISSISASKEYGSEPSVWVSIAGRL